MENKKEFFYKVAVLVVATIAFVLGAFMSGWE